MEEGNKLVTTTYKVSLTLTIEAETIPEACEIFWAKIYDDEVTSEKLDVIPTALID